MLRERQIDVHAAEFDANCDILYNLSEVTGLDVAVLAVVCNQSLAPALLREATVGIENDNLDSFTFVCLVATRRSVACCMLFAVVACPRATIYLATPRNQRGARRLRLLA